MDGIWSQIFMVIIYWLFIVLNKLINDLQPRFQENPQGCQDIFTRTQFSGEEMSPLSGDNLLYKHDCNSNQRIVIVSQRSCSFIPKSMKLTKVFISPTHYKITHVKLKYFIITMKTIILICVILQFAFADLLFVQELFRHGARYPLHPSEKDGTQYAIAENMAGELTDEGKRMHFLLGQKLKKDYWDLLGMNNTYNSSYVYIKSTNVNRTLESGESQFLGWVESLQPLTLTKELAEIAVPPWFNQTFETPEGPVFTKSPNFKPNAIHSEKQGANALNSGDFLLAHTQPNCPNVKSWAKQGYDSQFYKNVSNMDKVKNALNALQSALNDSKIDMVSASKYFENYQCSKRLGKNYSSVFDSQYQTDFKFIQSFVKYTDVASNDVQINATSTGFFNATLNSMKKIMHNKEKQKLVLYSAHDMTIVMILAALRLGSRQCAYNHYMNPNQNSGCIYEFPDFASSLIFQLHSIDSEYHVRFRYNGQYIKLPFCSSKDCSYSQFEKFFNETMRSTFISDCGVPPLPTVSKQKQLIIANAVIGFFLLLAVGYEIFLFVKKRRSASTSGEYGGHVDEV